MGSWWSTEDTTDNTERSTSQVYLKPKTFEDEYETIAYLGKGGFGTVKKVKEKATGNYYAVKEIITTGYDSDYIRREINSQRIVCEHRNVVKLENVYEEPGIVRILLEFCELGNMNDYVKKTYISTDLKCQLMRDMTNGLHFLHEKHIVHRDIKPENILLVSDYFRPTCKIADFGLAKHLDNYQGSYKIENGCGSYMESQLGTPLYIAPEILEGHYTRGCDIFSLGVVFYALFTTNTTGYGTELMPLINSHMLHEEIVTEKDIKRTLKKHKPKKMGKLVTKMLKKNYHDRIDCSMVQDELWEIYDKLQNPHRKSCVLC